MPLKVDPMVAHAEAVQDMPGALEFSKPLQFRAYYLVRQTAELPENLELQLLGELG